MTRLAKALIAVAVAAAASTGFWIGRETATPASATAPSNAMASRDGGAMVAELHAAPGLGVRRSPPASEMLPGAVPSSPLARDFDSKPPAVDPNSRPAACHTRYATRAQLAHQAFVGGMRYQPDERRQLLHGVVDLRAEAPIAPN